MSTENNATSLKHSIDAFVAQMSSHAPPAVVETLGAGIGKLAESGIVKNGLKVGATAPGFSLSDTHKAIVALSSVLAKGPAVVTFYRGGWCPFCDLQLRAYQGILPEIHKLGAELIAISPQTADYAQSDAEKKQLTFPVLHDAGNAVARKYGLVFRLSEVMQKLQQGFGNPLPKFNGDDSWEVPMPGTFVLDRSGIVRLAHIDPNYLVRLEPAAILSALRTAT